MTSPRWIELEGAFNVRDLGGLAIETGNTRRDVVLRADNLDSLSPDDVRVLTEQHHLRAVVDLRNVVECPQPPDWIAAAGVSHHLIPLLDLSGETASAMGEQLRVDVAAAYRRMLEMAGPAITAVLALITDDAGSSGSVLIHCAAGKDRTGIVAAVLLAAAGVPDDLVIADYLATAERIEAVRSMLRRRPLYRPPVAAEPLPAMTAEPIAAVLDALRDEPGGVTGYLRRWGVTPAQLERYRELIRPI